MLRSFSSSGVHPDAANSPQRHHGWCWEGDWVPAANKQTTPFSLNFSVNISANIRLPIGDRTQHDDIVCRRPCTNLTDSVATAQNGDRNRSSCVRGRPTALVFPTFGEHNRSVVCRSWSLVKGARCVRCACVWCKQIRRPLVQQY